MKTIDIFIPNAAAKLQALENNDDKDYEVINSEKTTQLIFQKKLELNKNKTKNGEENENNFNKNKFSNSINKRKIKTKIKGEKYETKISMESEEEEKCWETIEKKKRKNTKKQEHLKLTEKIHNLGEVLEKQRKSKKQEKFCFKTLKSLKKSYKRACYEPINRDHLKKIKKTRAFCRKTYRRLLKCGFGGNSILKKERFAFNEEEELYLKKLSIRNNFNQNKNNIYQNPTSILKKIGVLYHKNLSRKCDLKNLQQIQESKERKLMNTKNNSKTTDEDWEDFTFLPTCDIRCF